MNGLRGSRDQRVPTRETATFSEPAVGTGSRHPGEIRQSLWFQYDAIRDMFEPLRIVSTATARQIQEPAGDVGIVNCAGVLILELVQATAAASITQRLPFRASHLLERLALPKRRIPARTAVVGRLRHRPIV